MNIIHLPSGGYPWRMRIQIFQFETNVRLIGSHPSVGINSSLAPSGIVVNLFILIYTLFTMADYLITRFIGEHFLITRLLWQYVIAQTMTLRRINGLSRSIIYMIHIVSVVVAVMCCITSFGIDIRLQVRNELLYGRGHTLIYKTLLFV